MTQPPLRDTLQQLRDALGRTDPRDSATRERLHALAAELERALAQERPEGLTERLQAAAALFEAEHPELALLTARVIDALVKLGV